MSDRDDADVSPEEMAALMDTIKDTSRTRSREDDDGQPMDVVRFDLVAARAVGHGELPTLDLINDRFAILLGDSFERMTSRDVAVSARPAHQVKFVECTASFSNPLCIQIIDMSGLHGTGMLTIDPSILFHFFDLLLGGSPSEVSDAKIMLGERGMTEVERRLFSHVTNSIGDELTKAWQGVSDFGIRPVRAETDPRQAALFDPGEMVVDTILDVELDGYKGEIHLIFPQSSLRPVEKKLSSGLLEAESDKAVNWRKPLTELMKDVRTLCRAELGRTSMEVRELLALKVGDVLRLDKDPESTITVFIEQAPKLHGIPTMQHGNLAVEVQASIGAQSHDRPEEADNE